jgi:hypothetical protein
VAEGSGLLNRRRDKISTEGSNPSLSATQVDALSLCVGSSVISLRMTTYHTIVRSVACGIFYVSCAWIISPNSPTHEAGTHNPIPQHGRS